MPLKDEVLLGYLLLIGQSGFVHFAAGESSSAPHRGQTAHSSAMVQ